MIKDNEENMEEVNANEGCLKSKIYNNLGNVYRKLYEDEKAMKYYYLAINLNMGCKMHISNLHLNLFYT